MEIYCGRVSMQNFALLYAKDAMSKEVVTVGTGVKIREIEALFEEHDFNAFPVIEGGRMVGLVTKLDFLKHFVFTPKTIIPQYERLLEDPVRVIMSVTPLTISPETPLTRVLELMIETKRRSFPVVDGEGKLVGIISREDLMRKLK